ncbi:acyl-CoA dehydrogenase [Shewanella marina]|uniref:acyl-CoA dehydrogenase n=1 Tax=Shewanella marina TaxID=487319 RepID=UPI00046E81B9|nr:acyl-CoA dehydrogenase [Shewanella marina]
MYPYQAPLKNMNFMLSNVFNAEQVWQSIPQLAEYMDIETARAILEEAARLNEEVVAPLNRNSDEQGVQFNDGQVVTPDGFKQAYQHFVEGGWIGLCGEAEHGGMGMPKLLGILVDEIGYGASNAFTLYNSLTAGAALCINAHGSDELKQLYLPKLYSGEWAGAMDMTEPQAGSDLRNISTKATLADDGSYTITGTKIFITGGDQDLSENIIHLVLAKVEGNKGISLFLVPKIKVNDDQSLAGANGVSVGSIEHKMGLKGSSTCVMNFEQSQGFLIGKVNRGLVCMFTMMNYERLAIGIQGLGSGEAAYQLASQYAKEREQGLAVGAVKSGNQADPILVHGDVRRMLLTIKALNTAGRALAMHTGLQLDLAKFGEGQQQLDAVKFVGLLTPVAKAFLTDRGLDCTIMAQQVFGGHGYIRESGVEQLVRDTRIAQIYEGTNGIQANDFLGRKVLGDNLATVLQFIEQTKQDMAAFEHISAKHSAQLIELWQQFIDACMALNEVKLSQPNIINSCAVDSLDAFGYILYGYYLLKLQTHAATTDDAALYNHLVEFYFNKIIFKANYHLSQLTTGDDVVMAMSADLF